MPPLLFELSTILSADNGIATSAPCAIMLLQGSKINSHFDAF